MPYDYEPDLDGAMTINQTESACEVEQDSGFQLVDIHFDTKTDANGTVFLINKAGFNEKLSGRLNNLMFVEIKDDDDPDQIKTDKEALGWIFICKSKIYAENNTLDVSIFGKTS